MSARSSAASPSWRSSARHPSGMTLTEMAEEAGLTRAGARRFLLTLVATGYATQVGRVFSLSPRLLTVARTWLGGGSLWSFAAPIMRAVAAQLNEACSAADPVGPGCRLCRPHSRPPHPQRVARCRHPAAGLLHLDGANPACRPDAGGTRHISQPGDHREADAEDDHRKASAGRRDRQGEGGRLCHRRRGTGTRPAFDRRADPRPLRKHGRGHQRLDPVGAIHRRRRWNGKSCRRCLEPGSASRISSSSK